MVHWIINEFNTEHMVFQPQGVLWSTGRANTRAVWCLYMFCIHGWTNRFLGSRYTFTSGSVWNVVTAPVPGAQTLTEIP